MKNKPLNEKQKLFCELYATDREFFGNGVQAYIEAYNIDTSKRGAYDGAKASAHNLLTNTYIIDEINGLLQEGGLNDAHVDKRLLFWINQGANPQSSMKAIAEYNKLKERTKGSPLVDAEGLSEITNLLREMGTKK